MRLIRFVADDGRILLGVEDDASTARVVRDPRGVLLHRRRPSAVEQLRGKRAIVADDDLAMRQLVSAVLGKVGCRCESCSNGTEALQAIRNAEADLVVSDIMMPDHNGYEVFAAAKERDARMPVLLITGFGYDPTHSLIRASQAGLEAVLYKPFTPQQLLVEVCKACAMVNGPASDAFEQTEERVGILTLLAPVCAPNVLCVGANFGSSDPADEPPAADTLELFMKPTTTLIANGEPIRAPQFDGQDTQLDGEGELALVIGTRVKDASEDNAARCILGYTIATDVTSRRWQTPGGPPAWMRGKGFDTFCPLGPAIVTADDLPDPDQLTVSTFVNGRLARQGAVSEMRWSIPRLVSEISRRVTLEPGTVILTGGPALVDGQPERTGLGPGDEIAVEVPGIGRLVNPVVDG